MDINFLVIEGNIGAGKTTLASMISKEYQAKLILEQFADNPFLPKFYGDKHRYSFPLELTFLADRYSQIKKEALNFELFYNFIVSDYYFTKSAIFSRNTLKKDEYNLFRRIFDIIFETMPKPDLYVYLHVNIETLIKNIEIRGRDYEQDIDISYLENIRQGYINYLKHITDFPILILDTNNIDFVHNSDDYQKVKDAIFNSDYKLGINTVIL
jgi:deoxyadenosine/deoxycytidine kinase